MIGGLESTTKYEDPGRRIGVRPGRSGRPEQIRRRLPRPSRRSWNGGGCRGVAGRTAVRRLVGAAAGGADRNRRGFLRTEWDQPGHRAAGRGVAGMSSRGLGHGRPPPSPLRDLAAWLRDRSALGRHGRRGDGLVVDRSPAVPATPGERFGRPGPDVPATSAVALVGRFRSGRVRCGARSSGATSCSTSPTSSWRCPGSG